MFRFGFRPRPTRESPLSRPRSRTLVMFFFCAPFYRFFSRSPADFAHGFLLSPPAPGFPLEASRNFPRSRLSGRLIGLGLAGAGGHLRSPSQHSACLLLRLRRRPLPRRLRQNVRTEEIRLALVGHQLR